MDNLQTIYSAPAAYGNSLIMHIKATAMNRERARVWIESAAIGSFGFTRGAPINIVISDNAIDVYLDDSGKRKVAGRERGGKSISILDICMPLEQRELIRGNASRFLVTVTYGHITITRES